MTEYPLEYIVATRFTLGKDIEGGYVNDPLDRGGETNRGITDKADGKVDGKIDLDRNGTGDVAVRDLTEEQALGYYFRWYWQGLCEDLGVVYAALLFDCSVNHGYARAKKWKAECPDILSLLQRREHFYQDIVAHNPTQKRFIKGWLNRIDLFCKKFDVNYKTTR